MNFGFNMALTWQHKEGDIMNNRRLAFINSIFIVVSIFAIIIDWLKFEISERTYGFFNNFAILLNAIILLGMLIWSIIYLVKNISKIKWKALLPSIIIIFTIVLNVYMPLTEPFIKLNFLINSDSREKIVKMFEKNQMSNYQTGMDKYMVPLVYRLSTHNGRVYTQKSDDGVTKILFYVHCGINSSAIVYVSNDSGINEGDFGFKYHSKRFLKKNWYSAIILNKDN